MQGWSHGWSQSRDAGWRLPAGCLLGLMLYHCEMIHGDVPHPAPSTKMFPIPHCSKCLRAKPGAGSSLRPMDEGVMASVGLWDPTAHSSPREHTEMTLRGEELLAWPHQSPFASKEEGEKKRFRSEINIERACLFFFPPCSSGGGKLKAGTGNKSSWLPGCKSGGR